MCASVILIDVTKRSLARGAAIYELSPGEARLCQGHGVPGALDLLLF